jgi:hypothetical protein
VHAEDAELILDEDHAWFGRLGEKGIATLTQQDNVFRYAAFLKHTEEGLSAEDASRRVWKFLPYHYFHPSERGRNPLGLAGANAELPNRVSTLAASGRITKDLAERHETMNAIVRYVLQPRA